MTDPAPLTDEDRAKLAAGLTFATCACGWRTLWATPAVAATWMRVHRIRCIRRVMKVSTGTTLEWTPRPDGGLDLGVGGTMYVALTAEEFGWFMDDLRAIKPPGPVYRTGPGVIPRGESESVRD